MSLIVSAEQIQAQVEPDVCPTCHRPKPAPLDAADAGHLTARRRQILACIRTYIAEHGYAPAVRDIMAAVGLESPSTIHHHLGELERAGYIQRGGQGRSRALRLVDEPPALDGIRLASDYPGFGG
jgi:SOS-response transcriptional repressor LexA